MVPYPECVPNTDHRFGVKNFLLELTRENVKTIQTLKSETPAFLENSSPSQSRVQVFHLLRVKGMAEL